MRRWRLRALCCGKQEDVDHRLIGEQAVGETCYHRREKVTGQWETELSISTATSSPLGSQSVGKLAERNENALETRAMTNRPGHENSPKPDTIYERLNQVLHPRKPGCIKV